MAKKWLSSEIHFKGFESPSRLKNDNHYKKVKRLSAKSCGSCGQWSWVSVNVFPLCHVDHMANGPGYL